MNGLLLTASRLFLEKLEKACVVHRSIFKTYKDYYEIPKTVLLPGEEPPKYKPTSLVFAIFGGYLQSQVKCLSCSYESNTYDPFTDISLCINKASTIERSLFNFCEKEILDSENKYKCSGCKKKVQAQKQLTIYQNSNILTIQLKRFDHFGRKLTRPIQFKETLDLKPFLTKRPSAPKDGTIYELYGIIMHHGSSLKSGHYTTYVKSSNGTWLHVDDESVTTISKKTVFKASSEAYVLFYSRIDNNAHKKENTPEIVASKTVQSPQKAINLSSGMNFESYKKDFNIVESSKKKEKQKSADKVDIEKPQVSETKEPVKLVKMNPKKVVKELTKNSNTKDVKLDLMYNGHNVSKWDDAVNDKEIDEMQDKQLKTLETYKEQTKKRKRDQWDIDYDKGKLKKVRKKNEESQAGENSFQRTHELIAQGKVDLVRKKVQLAKKARQRKKLFEIRKLNKKKRM